MTAWFVILIVFSVLFAFWRLLGFVFWCWDYAAAGQRGEDRSTNREREQSDF